MIDKLFTEIIRVAEVRKHFPRGPHKAREPYGGQSCFRTGVLKS